MADEPHDLILDRLRAIRATLAEHSGRFDGLEKRMEDLHESMTYALGLAAHVNVRHETAEKRFQALEARVARLEEKA